MTIRILIADDHALVRHGICSLLADIEDVEVVAEAGDGVEALDLIDQHQPDLVLLDINMPRLSGLDCLTQIRLRWPELRVLMLSMHVNSEHVRDAIERGARGYLPKDASPSDLAVAIHQVMQGSLWLSPEVSAALSVAPGSALLKTDPSEFGLTPRQISVLKYLVEGASVKETAYYMGLSVKTVETYRSQIQERLQINDLPALVRFAIRHGLIQL